MEKKQYIQHFDVNKMWNRLDFSWQNIHEDVNILVGINGCGKTTLLNLIYSYYKGEKIKKELAVNVTGNSIDIPIQIIRSFDVPTKHKKKTESNLLNDLKGIIMQNNEGTSFFDYRMQMINYPDKRKRIEERINMFFNLINSLFAETDKFIDIDKTNNKLIFKIKGTSLYLTDNQGNYLTDNDGNRFTTEETHVQLEQLSSGEKQMLLILTMVFLQDEKPHILLLDEPEISLHISWQSKLIEIIRALNPNCQLILTTHSPSIFAKGWMDKIVFINELTKTNQ